MRTYLLFFLLIVSTQIMGQHQQKSTVDVTGEGIVKVIPDQVTVRVRVENTGKNARELKQQNDRVVNDVLEFLQEMKIDAKDYSTDYINLNKNYEYNTKTYNYSANQSITIKLRDLEKFDTLMNGLLETGINRIDGVNFSSSTRLALESEARKKAVTNAKVKATEYAGVLGQSIGKAISISEHIDRTYPQPLTRSVSMDMAVAGSDVKTLAPGEMEIRLTVRVSFELN